MICALALAAGESRRMGTQKLLLPYAGASVIARVIDVLLASRIDRVLVVLGCDADRITAALAGRPVQIVINADYQTGMLSSVRAGLRALPPECCAVLIALGDQPSITPEIVNKIVGHTIVGYSCREWPGTSVAIREAALAKGGPPPSIIIPSFEGRRGHPLLFSADYRDEILSNYDETGLRGLLAAHPEQVREIPVSTDAILADMDYPEDYQRELARLEVQRRKES